MSSGQKAAFSFLTALILFAGFVFFAHTGLMAQIETKFYAQAKIEEKNSQLEKLGQSCNSYISEILTTIQTGDKAYLKSSAVRTYVHQNPSEKDAAERINLTAHLFDQLEDYGLDGMRLIEKNGRTLHYSSFDSVNETLAVLVFSNALQAKIFQNILCLLVHFVRAGGHMLGILWNDGYYILVKPSEKA